MFVPRYTEDEAREAIAASRTYAEALRRLGMCHTGGAHKIIKKYAEEIWRIPVDHFDSDAVCNEALERARRSPRPLSELLVEGLFVNRMDLKERLYREGLKQPVCELCGQGEIWRGTRISLILDHVNGVRDDNRLENLRIVCPNCAATLDTHCGRNGARLPVERHCEGCGSTFRPKYTRHRFCSRSCGSRHGNRPQRGVPAPHRRKVPRPSIDQLLADVDEMGYLATGRKYGVSDNAIRKWIAWYERELQVWVTSTPRDVLIAEALAEAA